jgi:hypothetical protein
VYWIAFSSRRNPAKENTCHFRRVFVMAEAKNNIKFSAHIYSNPTAWPMASVAQNPAVKILRIRNNNFYLRKKLQAGGWRYQNSQDPVPAVSLIPKQKHHAQASCLNMPLQYPSRCQIRSRPVQGSMKSSRNCEKP